MISPDSRVSGVETDASAILESITDAFFALDHGWAFTYVNRRAEQLLGRSRDELLGKNIWQEYPLLAGTEFEDLYRSAMARQAGGSVTSWYAEHQRYYEVHVYPSAGGIAVYFRDATERTMAQQRMRASEEKFRHMANAIPQIVWIVGADGRAEFYNRQWSLYTGAEHFGETPEDVAVNFIHPEDVAPTMQAWQEAARAGGVFSVEHRIRSANGDYRWFLVRAEPVRDERSGEIQRWYGTSTDVHDRKLTEAALHRSEARYRSLFNSIDAGFCIIEMMFDADGNPQDYRFLETNPAFEKQTGIPDAAGKRMRELVPQHEKHWFDIYGKVALTGEPIRFENVAQGLGRWFDVYAFRVDEPEARRVAVLFTDITGRRRNEADLQQNAQRKDEFLAMLAHELRNPLAPIVAAAELLATGRVGMERLPDITSIIGRHARHMTELLEDLLDVSRVTRGLATLDRQVVDLRGVVTEAVEQARPLMEEKGHRLTLRLAPQPAVVLGDRKRLIQVLANLLGNAAKYTPAGNGSIDLALDVDESQVVLTVSDNGIGMSPELIAHAFDLFSQGERSADRSQGGLGIGLALVRTLVQLHEGSIVVASEGRGRGTSFTVRLPRLVQQKVAGPAPPSTAPTSSGALRIMVIDDNADAAQLLALLLTQAGHQTRVGHHARDALALAPQFLPQVCLLDIGLPDVDGNTLVRQLRALPQLAGTIYAALTGYGQPQDQAASLKAGFDRHLVKPVDTAALISWLDGLRPG